MDPEISGGGHFVDLGSHILDLLDWLLGPVTHAAGIATNRGGRYPAEDLVTAVFSFRSGVEGVGVWNYDSFQHKDQIEISGTAGALRFSCFADEPLRLLTARGVEQIKAPYPETVQLPLIQTVVNALIGNGESPSNGDSALRTARVIDTLLSDYRDSHGISFSPRVETALNDTASSARIRLVVAHQARSVAKGGLLSLTRASRGRTTASEPTKLDSVSRRLRPHWCCAPGQLDERGLRSDYDRGRDCRCCGNDLWGCHRRAFRLRPDARGVI